MARGPRRGPPRVPRAGLTAYSTRPGGAGADRPPSPATSQEELWTPEGHARRPGATEPAVSAAGTGRAPVPPSRRPGAAPTVSPAPASASPRPALTHVAAAHGHGQVAQVRRGPHPQEERVRQPHDVEVHQLLPQPRAEVVQGDAPARGGPRPLHAASRPGPPARDPSRLRWPVRGRPEQAIAQ